MDIETQALIRTAEDVLSLSRQMKELWLFGSLDTMGKSGAVEQTENDARAAATLVDDLLKKGLLFGSTSGSAAREGSVQSVET